jgi:hypothetical protein
MISGLGGRDHVGDLHELEGAGESLHTAVREFDDAVRGGEQGVIAALGDVQTRADLGAALTHDDIADLGKFTSVELCPQALTLGIAAVGCRAACFFMSHKGYD